MNSTEINQNSGGQSVTSVILPASGGFQSSDRSEGLPSGAAIGAQPAIPKKCGYGLPCAKCRTYYAADLQACPICKSPERVSPTMGSAATAATAAAAMETQPDAAALEAERDRFLKEFNLQVQAGSMQINASATFRCSKIENHEGAFEPAAVCQGCYDHLQEQIDTAEAALHMDVREAAQVIYEAVWADPSDPRKTYQNAAQAILCELRRRAGITTLLGSVQQLQH